MEGLFFVFFSGACFRCKIEQKELRTTRRRKGGEGGGRKEKRGGEGEGEKRELDAVPTGRAYDRTTTRDGIPSNHHQLLLESQSLNKVWEMLIYILYKMDSI